MKQESVFDPIVLKGSLVNSSFRKVFLILVAILVTAILAISIYMIVSDGMPAAEVEPAVIPERSFLAVNPETRYAGQTVVSGARMEAASFLAANPETRYAHSVPVSLIKTAERAFLAVNPETRYAGQIAVSSVQMAEASFLAANPEIRYLHLDTVALTIASERAFIAVNPETKYAIVDIDQNGSVDFFEANPEVMFHLRYQDANVSK